MHLTYEWMEPKKKRRVLFRSEEYRNAESVEDAFWMAVQETKLFSLLDWFGSSAGPKKSSTPTSAST